MADRQQARYLRVSEHAVCQARKRGMPGEVIPYVVAHGKRYHFNGGEWYYLRRRDIAWADRTRFERFAGVTVLIAQDTNLVVTVFRLKRWRRDLVLAQTA